MKSALLRLLPDELFIKLKYRHRFGRAIDLKSPKTFNEKLQWLKLYDRRPEYTKMVDKYAVKKYVADKIGEQYIIPTLGVWEKFDDIDFDILPNQFVLKCTHDSGGLVICRDKTKFDKEAAKRKIEICLKRNYYYHGREWPYKNVRPRIIAEVLMTDESGFELKDYKIFNFNGEPYIIQVDFDRFIKHKRNLYNTNWNYLDIRYLYPNDPNKKIDKPQNLEKMLLLARKLSTNLPFVRSDFYVIEDKIYFGELTFYPESGFGKFSSDDIAVKLGKMIQLPEKKKE